MKTRLSIRCYSNAGLPAMLKTCRGIISEWYLFNNKLDFEAADLDVVGATTPMTINAMASTPVGRPPIAKRLSVQFQNCS